MALGAEVVDHVRRNLDGTMSDFVTGGVNVMGRAPRPVMDFRRKRPLAIPFEYLRIFDLYDVTATTCKVRGFDTASDELACIAGVHTAISGGGEALDTAITIAAAAYLYVNITKDFDTSTATLEQTATYGDGDADEERFYLWYIGWASSAINLPATVDLRGMPRWMGFRWQTPATDYEVFQRKADDSLDFDWVRAHA